MICCKLHPNSKDNKWLPARCFFFSNVPRGPNITRSLPLVGPPLFLDVRLEIWTTLTTPRFCQDGRACATCLSRPYSSTAALETRWETMCGRGWGSCSVFKVRASQDIEVDVISVFQAVGQNQRSLFSGTLTVEWGRGSGYKHFSRPQGVCNMESETRRAWTSPAEPLMADAALKLGRAAEH